MDDPREHSDLPTTPEALGALQPPPPAPENAAPGERHDTVKGIKETIESILIAFILAFVFRAFVVEAFVIPTGSMAPTLLGAHMRFTCHECGYGFDVGYQSPEREGADIDIRDRAERSYVVYCPNCKWKVPRDESAKPPIRYGDRILVLKYLYIPWVSSPKRWDVVVFKSPQHIGYGTPDYVTNYIKRLIGLPGEWVMILDGDIYVCDQERYAILEDIREIPDEKVNEAWKIQRKPRHAQQALWRIIYDHDFRPLTAGGKAGEPRSDGWRLPWVPQAGSGWDTGDRTSRVFTFKNSTGGGMLKFDPKTDPYYDPKASPPSMYFSDWLAYDVAQRDPPFRVDPDWDFATIQREHQKAWERHNPRTYSLYTVSDLKLAFSYHRTAGDGPLRANLTKNGHAFAAEFTPGKVRLIHRKPDGTEHVYLDRALRSTSGAAPLRVELENVDHRVTLRLDGETVCQTTDEQYRPDVRTLLGEYFKSRGNFQFAPPSVSVEASKQEAQLSHVSLWRDVYYTPADTGGSELRQGSPEKPIKLGKGPDQNEYFVLGDNSAASSDGRFWDAPVHLEHEGDLQVEQGRVPGRFMLGKAFFVYWPAGYRPLTTQAPAVVPNFGEMRFIE
jgi:signal peptidase I